MVHDSNNGVSGINRFLSQSEKIKSILRQAALARKKLFLMRSKKDETVVSRLIIFHAV